MLTSSLDFLSYEAVYIPGSRMFILHTGNSGSGLYHFHKHMTSLLVELVCYIVSDA